MTWKRLGLHAALILLVSGCAMNPPPVPIEGSAPEVAQLAGRWSGTYRGTESGRTGSISFSLSAAADSAYGYVWMTRGARAPLASEEGDWGF